MFRYRHLSRWAAAALCVLVPLGAVHAGPRFWGWKSTIRANVGVRYSTNIDSNNAGRSDFTYRGGLDIDLSRDRRDSIWNLNLGTDLFRFSSETDENSNDFRATLRFEPNQPRFSSRFQGNGSIGWVRSTDADPVLGTRLQRNRFTFRYGAIYTANTKWSLGADGSYNWEDPQNRDSGNLARVSNWRLSSTAYYRYSPKLAFTAGGSYARSSGSRNRTFQSDNTTVSVSTGVDGQITPKISGSVSVGWQIRDAERETDTESAPFVSASLAWSVNSRTSVALSASSDFSTLVSDQLTETQSISLQYNRQLGIGINLNALASFQTSRIRSFGLTRTDDSYSASLTASYRLNDWSALSLQANWNDQRSSLPAFSFDRQAVELRMRFTY